jgi:hypothetical protein
MRSHQPRRSDRLCPSAKRQLGEGGGSEAGGANDRLDMVVVVMSFLDLVLSGIPDWLVRTCPP